MRKLGAVEGFFVGHDLSSDEWSRSVDRAIEQSLNKPFILQEFIPAKVIEHPYFDPETGKEKVMKGRVRLCPYYFTRQDGKTQLSGCLATIVPLDKKKIHGMEQAILVPCSF